MIYGPHDLASDLRALLGYQLSERAQIDAWERRVHLIKERIGAHSGKPYRIPAVVWRFLNDADLRVENPSYDRRIKRRMRRAVAVLETTDPN